MGSRHSTATQFQPPAIPAISAHYYKRDHIPASADQYSENEISLITMFVLYFEHTSYTQLPVDIIPIIIHYYHKLTQTNPEWLEIDYQLSIKDFSLKNRRNCPSFGPLWQAQLKANSKMYTLQILKKRDLTISTNNVQTRQLLHSIDNPFIWSIHKAFQTKTKLFIVRDLFYGKHLFSFIAETHQNKMTEPMARFYTAEICLALHYIHCLNTVYFGFSPQNIFITTDGHIKLADIDIGMSADNGLLHVFDTVSTNIEYSAPEMLYEGNDISMNKMADWWCVGIILYEMICGLPAFYDNDIDTMYQKILFGNVPFYRFMSAESVEIIGKLLRKNADERIGFDEIVKERFFESIDWDKLYKKEIVPPLQTNSVFTNANCSNSNSGAEMSYSFPENYECYRRRSNSSSVLFGE